MADQKQWPEQISVALVHHEEIGERLEALPIGDDYGVWENGLPTETYVPKAALEEERRRADGYSKDYSEARAECDRLDNRIGGLMRAHSAEANRAEKAEAALASERERIVNQLQARNLLTIEVEEAIRGPLSPSPVEGECERCGGDGIEDAGPIPTCCGKAAADGDCCGCPEPSPDYVQCEVCHGTGKKQPDPATEISDILADQANHLALESDPEEGREAAAERCRCGHGRDDHWHGGCGAYLAYPTAEQTNRCGCVSFHPDSNKEADRC